MVTGLFGSLIAAGANIGMGFYNNHHNAKQARAADERGYSYSKKLMRLQDALYRRQLVDSPSLTRKGLEAAGYNPMLALGNLTHASMPSSAFNSKQNTSNVSIDAESAMRAGKALQELTLETAKAQKDNIEADTKLKEGQLDSVETQRLQTEANTALIHSQTERSDLAYGRDIVGTVADAAGTAGSLYSAKAMSDVAKANAATAARNATVNEKRLEKGRNASASAPTVKHTPKAPNPNVGGLGHSAKSVSSVAKQVAKELLLLSPAGLVGAGVGYGMKPVLEREMIEHEKKNRDPVRNSSKWKWLMNFDRYHFNY